MEGDSRCFETVFVLHDLHSLLERFPLTLVEVQDHGLMLIP